MSLPIKSIHRGEKTFSVGVRYKRICEEWKMIRAGEGNKFEVIVYRVYDHSDNIVVEIEANNMLVIYYGT